MEVFKLKEIVVIAPTKEIFDNASDIVMNESYENIDVVKGNLNDGFQKAKALIKMGAKIIISRGGTYTLIKDNCMIPVVEIKVDAYDILESYKKVEDVSQPLGIVGFDNVIYGFNMIQQFLNSNITMIRVEDEGEVYSIIDKYRKEGISTFIGDSIVEKVAQSLKCKAILIESHQDAILSAVQEAIRILNATKTERYKRQQIETMIDFVHDGIINVDKEGIIRYFNKSAENLFGISKERALFNDIKSVISNTALCEVMETKEPQFGRIQRVNDTKVIANRVPIIIDNEVEGAVATFQDVTEISAFEHQIRRSLSKNGFAAKYKFEDIIFKSEKLKKCIETAKEYALYDTPILILGESGSGKELICQSIHNYSQRAKEPFVAVNCAALPPSLIESEFFGYEEGAFTGARRKGKEGVFELAHNGTLFLDEISELPIELQGRLLRVLQEKQVMRLGGDKVIPIDVKIICASNKNLKNMMQEGKFRKDLYFRICVLRLYIPSLNERKEDIIELANYFIKKYSVKYNKDFIKISSEIESRLINRKYEGNIRELEGIMEQSVIMSSFAGLMEEETELYSDKPNQMIKEGLFGDMYDLKTMSDQYILQVFKNTNNNINETCKILKISRSTLWRKVNGK